MVLLLVSLDELGEESSVGEAGLTEVSVRIGIAGETRYRQLKYPADYIRPVAEYERHF